MYFEDDLQKDLFFKKHEKQIGDDIAFRMYRTYLVCLKNIMFDLFFLDYKSVQSKDLEIYKNLFNLNELFDDGVDNDQLLLIVRNIYFLLANAGTVECLRLIGIIKTGGNSLIFKDSYNYDGKIQYDKTGTYGSLITTNDLEIIFVNGAFLIDLVNGTTALQALINRFKSLRDYVQIV